MVTAIARANIASLVVVIQFVINLSGATLYLSWRSSMAPGNPFSLLWEAIMASFSVDHSRLMANAHNTIHRLERYVTRALTRTISDVYLNISEIRTIVIEIRTVLTDLQDSIAIPITQIGPIHDAIIPMHTQQLPAFERRLNSIALQADARRFAADLRQKLNTATDPQIIELMDRIVQPHAKLHIAGRDGTHYPNYQELRDAVLHGQVDPDDLREGLAAWLEGILAL